MSYWSRSHEGSNRIVVGITSRSSQRDLQWLMDFIKMTFRDHVSDVKYLPISNSNRIEWERNVRICPVAILYHTKRQGRINITDVEGALYDEELQMLSTTLGRSKVLVVLDDLENCSDTERQRILDAQPRVHRLSSGILLFPEEGKREEAAKMLEEFIKLLGIKAAARDPQPSTMKTKDSSSSSLGGFMSWLTPSDKSRKTISDYKQKLTSTGMPSILPQPRLKISIFSRSAESNYGWLVEELKTTCMTRPVDVRSVYISNTASPFYSELSNCSFAILYHTKKQGRINITDVTDNLYDEELRDLSMTLGKENVIVVVDDLENADPSERERILRNQPSIGRLARGLFLFNEKKKNRENLEEIHQILKKSMPRIEVPSNGYRPDKADGNHSASSTYPGFPDPALSLDSSVDHKPTSPMSQLPAERRRPDKSTLHDDTMWQGANYSGGPDAKRRNLDPIELTPCSSKASAEVESAIQEAFTYSTLFSETISKANMKWREYEQHKEKESRDMAEQIQRLRRENEELKCEKSDLVLRMRENEDTQNQILETYNKTVEEKEKEGRAMEKLRQDLRNKDKIMADNQEMARKMEDEMKELKKKLNETEELLKVEKRARNEAERAMEKFRHELREKYKTIEEKEDMIRKIEEKIQQLQTDDHVTETNPRKDQAGPESQRYQVRSPIPGKEADHTSSNQGLTKYEWKEEASSQDRTQWNTTTLYDPGQKPSEAQSLREAEEQIRELRRTIREKEEEIQELRRTIREKEEEIQKMKTQREDNELLIDDILSYLRGEKNTKS